MVSATASRPISGSRSKSRHHQQKKSPRAARGEKQGACAVCEKISQAAPVLIGLNGLGNRRGQRYRSRTPGGRDRSRCRACICRKPGRCIPVSRHRSAASISPSLATHGQDRQGHQLPRSHGVILDRGQVAQNETPRCRAQALRVNACVLSSCN